VTRRQYLRNLISNGDFHLSKKCVFTYRRGGGVLVEASKEKGCDAHRLAEWKCHARWCGRDRNAD